MQSGRWYRFRIDQIQTSLPVPACSRGYSDTQHVIFFFGSVSVSTIYEDKVGPLLHAGKLCCGPWACNKRTSTVSISDIRCNMMPCEKNPDKSESRTLSLWPYSAYCNYHKKPICCVLFIFVVASIVSIHVMSGFSGTLSPFSGLEARTQSL